MFARGKKPVTLEYKEKLLADIAYYEKRIEEALNKRVHNSIQDVESSDEEPNPYTVNMGPLPMELKREEARLSNCVSMTLELAMLTIMQSEVNVMAVAPDVRRPVEEDGTWLEVAAECKIDLISFTITFYAHKPHRKYAPTRYRNLQVCLTKAAHQKELAQSVLAKLKQPNLALQVLQSYATAFRSRRTTLLELAETYADRLTMEPMPEGGYRVKFLDLLTVEWMLENMWSPVVPFFHRMKFDVEYMSKHYIHAIGKLYKQFKDPSMQTSERTDVLSKIFDICLEAQGPAREMQDAFESDPETAGRQHERRTTIDQEPEVPSNCDQNIQLSPQKLPKGKENKAQNRKTTMAPPKSLPKKAKKVTNAKNKANNEVIDDNVSTTSKNSERVVNGDDVTKKTKPNDKNATENRKGVKRAMENDATSSAKKIRINEKNGSETTYKVTENDSEVPSVSLNDDRQKNDSKAGSKNTGNKDTAVNAKNDASKKKPDTGKGVNTKNLNKASETSAKTVAIKDATSKNASNSKDKDAEADAAASKNKAKERRKVGSVASSKTSKKGADINDDKNVASQGQDTEGNVNSSKNSKKGEEGKSVASSKNASEKDSAGGGSSRDLNKKVNEDNNKAPSKNLKDTVNSASSKSKNAVEKDANKNENKAKSSEIVDKTKVNAEKIPQTDNNETEKPSKPPIKNKASINTKTKDSNQVAKQNEDKEVTEKSVKAKQNNDKVVSKSNDKNKASLLGGAVNKKLTHIVKNKSDENTNTKTVENTQKKKEYLGQKLVKPHPEGAKNIGINNKNTGTVIEKTKTMVPKISNAQEKNKHLAKNLNGNEIVEKVVESNKETAKVSTNNIKNLNRNKTDKLQNNIPKKIVPLITTSTGIKTNVPTDKSKENQAKAADKLTTRIPMMKNKLKIGALNNKLGKTGAKFGTNVEKTKIPRNSLPFFKAIARNTTRMSPRKIPSTFKPSSHGFSNK